LQPCRHPVRQGFAFSDVVRQIPDRRWLGLTATPYRRVGQLPAAGAQEGAERRLVRHHTTYRYSGDTDPLAPGGISAVYRDLVADDDLR
jgi:hypothetical protein